MRYTLREISKEDLNTINSWRNDKELVDLLGNNLLFIAQEVDSQWYENYLNSRDRNVRLGIIDSDKAKLIGTVQLTNIHHLNRSAEFSIMIGDKAYWSKGAGAYSTKAIITHGFRDLNLNRIYLTVLETNERAIKVYEKSGFQREGIQREAVFKNGIFVNLIQMAILKNDNHSYS